VIEALKALKDISIFAFHNILSYGIMLAVMMYNGYMFISVVLGAFIGYFLFGHISMKTNMENLQAIQTKIVCSNRCADSGESHFLYLHLCKYFLCTISLNSQNLSYYLENF
jgi:Ctr copper transporter family